jgi:hypothetical protein
MIVRFRPTMKRTLSNEYIHAGSKPKYNKARVDPATFKVTDLWGSQ